MKAFVLSWRSVNQNGQGIDGAARGRTEDIFGAGDGLDHGGVRGLLLRALPADDGSDSKACLTGCTGPPADHMGHLVPFDPVRVARCPVARTRYAIRMWFAQHCVWVSSHTLHRSRVHPTSGSECTSNASGRASGHGWVLLLPRALAQASNQACLAYGLRDHYRRSKVQAGQG